MLSSSQGNIPVQWGDHLTILKCKKPVQLAYQFICAPHLIVSERGQQPSEKNIQYRYHTAFRSATIPGFNFVQFFSGF